MAHILKVLLYIPIIWVISALARKDWQYWIEGFSSKRIQVKTVITISVLIGIYSISYNHTFWWADVTYYDRLFSNNLPITESPGLNLIYSILHLSTTDTDVLLFCVSFLACAMTLISYRMFDDAEPESLLFLTLTPFFIETCQVNLKQGIACGLASMVFVSFTQKKYAAAIAFGIVATLFHVTAGPILILSCIAIYGISIKNNVVKLIVFGAILISLFQFDTMISLIGKMGSFIPGLSVKLSEYATESGGFESDTTSLIIFKGIPYYLISLVGIYDRKYYENDIAHYDEYLTISLLASITYAMSAYSYWMSRVINYYWMCDFVFLSLLLSRMQNHNNKMIIKYGIICMLFAITFRELIQIYL